VAVANQAASWIEPERLEGYAALYARIRDITAISNGSGNKFLDGPQFVNVFADLQIGRANAQDVLRILSQIEHAYGAEDGNQVGRRTAIAERLKVATVTAQR
jgi:7,8-dihydro-6-hydroxymethylpterin-pyrophosphokinase